MNRKLKPAILSLLLGVGTSVLLMSCQPTLPAARASDAGHYSFARQIVPTLLGRKAKGYDEIKLLADLSVAGGRQNVVRALMQQPEYVNQWSEAMVDQLRITRAPSDPKYQIDCFGAPLRSGSDGGALADWVRSHKPDAGSAPGGPFNMTDLLRSALELDDLSPVYRAYLFAMINRPLGGNQIVEMNKRDDFGVNFGRVYIHRQMLCLSCHSSDFSISGESSGWNRTHPVPGSFERAVYGATYASIDTRRTNAVFRTDVKSNVTGAIKPWGIDAGCGMFQRTVPSDDPTEGLPANMTGYFITDTGRTGSIWNVEAALAVGYTELINNGVVRTGTDANGDGWLDTVDGNGGFAFMVAANSVNQTWSEIFGYPVTIANYYPRNEPQLSALWSQSEYNFIRNHWSLRGVLEEVVLSDLYNRLPPQTSDGTTGYELPMLFDPWVAADPRLTPTPTGPENYNNAMGEMVHRYSPRSLLYSIHSALDWPTPVRFPTSNYPDDGLEKAIGQFFKDAEPGFKGVDFQGLLYWESIHGAGVKPPGVTGTDWVNRLIAAMGTFNAANPNAPLKLSEVIATTKDWIIGDSLIYSAAPAEESVSEAQALQTLFAVSSLDTSAAGVPQLETKLRQYVGVLLESPQFFLAGIAPASLGTRPRLRVCNTGACSYQQLCQALQSAYAQQGYALTCNADSVSIVSLIRIDPNDYKVCPSGLCGFIYLPPDFPKCFINAGTNPGSCRLDAPHCDPRCQRLDCCGGPMPSPDSNFAFLAWADGGKVRKAQGIRFLRKGKKEFETLNKGEVLSTGDILIIPVQSHLQIDTRGGKFSTPKHGMTSRLAFQRKTEQLRATEAEDYWVMLVTGPSALAPPAKARSVPMRPQQATDLLINSEGLQRGEAGQPIDPQAKQDLDERRMNRRTPKPKAQPSPSPSP